VYIYQNKDLTYFKSHICRIIKFEYNDKDMNDYDIRFHFLDSNLETFKSDLVKNIENILAKRPISINYIKYLDSI
jgi:hypothetical protein